MPNAMASYLNNPKLRMLSDKLMATIANKDFSSKEIIWAALIACIQMENKKHEKLGVIDSIRQLESLLELSHLINTD